MHEAVEALDGRPHVGDGSDRSAVEGFAAWPQILDAAADAAPITVAAAAGAADLIAGVLWVP